MDKLLHNNTCKPEGAVACFLGKNMRLLLVSVQEAEVMKKDGFIEESC